MIWFLLLVFVTFPAPDDAPAADPRPTPAMFFPIGERLVYTGHLKKAGVSVRVGEAVFDVTRDKKGRGRL